MTNGAENPAPFSCPLGDEKWVFLQLQRGSAGRAEGASRLSVGLGCDFKILDNACRFGNEQAVFTKAFNMELNGFTDFTLGFLNGVTSSNTARQVG